MKPLGKAKERKKRVKVYMKMMVEGRRLIPLERHKKNGVKKVAVAELLTLLASEKREKPKSKRQWRVAKKAERMLETRQLTKREKTLWVVLAVAAGEFNPINPTNKPIRPMNGQTKQWENAEIHTYQAVSKERMAIVGVGFGWMVWMMLNSVNFPPGRTVRYIPPVGSKLAIFIRPRLTTQGEALQNQESAPWILLSIIWYLTMLREQGMHSNYPKKQKRKTLPQYAVIFAFAS